MRKFLLALAAVAVLVPSVAPRANAANVTAVFSYAATGGTAIAPGSTGADITANYGLLAFYHTLAADAKKCDLTSAGGALVTDASIIKKLASQPGDQTFAIGTLNAPAGGASGTTSGTAYFSGWSASSTLTNAALLNTSDSAAGALLCGGNIGCSGVATTNKGGVLCKSGALAAKDTTNATNCANAGQVQGANGTSTVETFVYPFAGSLCNGEQTLAECCGDANLVIITHTLEIQNDKGDPAYLSIITDQGTGGTANAWLQ